MSFINWLFQSDWMPHRYCVLGNPWLVWPQVIADAIIALSFITMPFAIAQFVNKNHEKLVAAGIGFVRLFALLELFMFCCGVRHLVQVYTMFVGAYVLDEMVTLVTACFALPTAVAVFWGVSRANFMWADSLVIERLERAMTRLAGIIVRIRPKSTIIPQPDTIITHETAPSP